MREMRFSGLMLAVLCSITSAVAVRAAGPVEDVKARYAELSSAVAAKDLAKVASIYSAEATFQVETPGGKDRVSGLESIKEMWQRAIRDGAVSFDAAVTEAAAKEDVLTEKGTFVMKKKDGSAFLKGTYSAGWRREKGIWKVTSHQLVGK